MLKALAAEELAEAQLNFTEALQKDDDETLGALGDELLQIGFWKRRKRYLKPCSNDILIMKLCCFL